MTVLHFFLPGSDALLWSATSDHVPAVDDTVAHVIHRFPTAMDMAGLGVKAKDPVYVHTEYRVMQRKLNVRGYEGQTRLELGTWALTIERVKTWDEFPTRKRVQG